MAAVLSPLLWSFLPTQITHLILPYLSTSLPQIFPPHPKGSLGYRRNFRIAATGVIGGWLIYSFVTDKSIAGDQDDGDWYALLGVRRDIDDDGLKRAFRSLSRTHHPDRAGIQNDGAFIAIRQAYEGLSDPVKRYAYDRFGPGILTWKNHSTVKDNILTGLMQSAGFYIVSAGIMIFLTVVGKSREGAYWRNTLFILILLLELNLILSPTPSSINHTHLLSLLPSFLSSLIRFVILPHRFLAKPQYSQIQFLHKVWTSLSMGIAQLAGIWSNGLDGNIEDPRIVEEVATLVKTLEVEAVVQFQAEVVPFLQSHQNPHDMEQYIQHEMEQVIVDKTLSSHPEIRNLWQRAITNRHRPSFPIDTFPVPQSDDHSQKSSLMLAINSSLEEVQLASRIPLPPSPPATPILRNLELPE